LSTMNRVVTLLIAAFGVAIVVLWVSAQLEHDGIFQDIPDSHHELRLADGIAAPEVSREQALATAIAHGGGNRVGPGGIREAYLVWEKDVSKDPPQDHLVWAVSFKVTPGTRTLEGPCGVPFEAAYALGFVDAHTREYLSTSEGWKLVPSGTPSVSPCY